MMINKLKVVSIAIVFLVIALWSNTQGMEKPRDLLESNIVDSGTKVQLSAQNVSDEFTSDLVPASLVNLEGTTTSWTSYCLSPVKATVRNAYNLANYMIKNPQKGIMVCVYLSAQILSASANTCVLYYEVPEFGNVNMTLNNIASGNCNLCEVFCKGGFELSTQFVNGTYPCINWTC